MYWSNSVLNQSFHLIVWIDLISFHVNVFKQRRSDAGITQLSAFRLPSIFETPEVSLHPIEAFRSHSINAVERDPVFQIIHKVSCLCLRVYIMAVVR